MLGDAESAPRRVEALGLGLVGHRENRDGQQSERTGDAFHLHAHLP